MTSALPCAAQAQQLDSTEEPGAVPAPPRKAQAEDLGRLPRVFLGGLAGGTAAVQVMFRVRIVRPLLFEVGGLVIPGAGNGSVSLIYEQLVGRRLAPYVAVGAGGMAGCGTGTETNEETGEEEESAGCAGLGVFAPRTGVAIYAEKERNVLITLDAGIWVKNFDFVYASVIPMAGAGLYFGF